MNKTILKTYVLHDGPLMHYSQTSTRDHLCTMANSLQQPPVLVLVDNPYIRFYFNHDGHLVTKTHIGFKSNLLKTARKSATDER